MKLIALNQTIEIKNSTGFIPFPFYDINHSSNLVLISNHIRLDENVDIELVNQVVLKGVIDLLSFKYNGLNNKDNIVLNWLISKIDITKEIFEVIDDKKIKYFRKK